MKHEVLMKHESQSPREASSSHTRNRIKWFLLIPVVLCVSGAVTFFLRAQDSNKLTTTTQHSKLNKYLLSTRGRAPRLLILRCPRHCRPTQTPPFMRVPMVTSATGTPTLAHLCARDNYSP
jgi:hypothetical protein